MVEFWEILEENGNPTGLLHERGKPLKKGEYHLTVSVWIENSDGKYLISKRSVNKQYPSLWECTGGNVIAGDDSLRTALKETKEELGIDLNAKNGQMIRYHSRRCICNHCLNDIWLFRQNYDISAITLAPDETCEAMWATREEIDNMIKNGTFITWGQFSNMSELFNSN